MEHPQNFNGLILHSIRDEVRRAGDDELPGAGPPSRPAAVWGVSELLNRSNKVGADAAGNLAASMLLEEAPDFLKIVSGFFRPKDLHT